MGDQEEVEGQDTATRPEGETVTHPITAPPAADELPEPGPPTTPATGYTGDTGGTTSGTGDTGPSTGDLGSAGSAGGTV